MTSNHGRRLDRLEEAHAPSGRPERWHQVIGDTKAELDQRIAELIASGEASASDGFIRNLIVDPPQRNEV
jgi:hypothetical protein